MQTKDTRPVAEQEADTDRAILAVLLADPGLWSVAEIGRELANPVEAENGIARLYAAGLVHRLADGFVFPTRAAARADALGG